MSPKHIEKRNCNLNIPLLLILATLSVSGCSSIWTNNLTDRLTPSNNRSWIEELTVLPTAVINGDEIVLKNVRNANYLTDENYIVDYADRTIQLDDVRTVDFVVTPFNNIPAIAHTMLSFGLSDGSYIGVSVEIRTEIGEKYSPFLGISNQFEITYVIADERDLIRVRTEHRNSDVYVYPSVATPEQSQRLFLDILNRVNQLNESPEFYHSIFNNCTTNLVDHVNNLRTDKIGFSWQILLPGFSAKYAYELGLIDNRIPFEDLKNIAHVNDAVRKHYYDPDFSQKIRQSHQRINRLSTRIEGTP